MRLTYKISKSIKTLFTILIMNKMRIAIAFLAVVMVSQFTSCSEDEDKKGGDRSTGVWNAKLNGTTWTAGRIDKVVYNTSVQFNAYSNSDKSVMILGFPGEPSVNNFSIPSVGIYVSYYGDVNVTSTMEDANEGLITVTKYTADSLVATFNFKTSTREFTEGKIKIKHN